MDPEAVGKELARLFIDSLIKGGDYTDEETAEILRGMILGFEVYLKRETK